MHISLKTPFKVLISSLYAYKLFTIYLHTQCMHIYVNRQARVALGDRIRNSLQLTALRLKPSRLLGVQAPTNVLSIVDHRQYQDFRIIINATDPKRYVWHMGQSENGFDEYENIGMYAHPSIMTNTM